jgi:hypothetical protein
MLGDDVSIIETQRVIVRARKTSRTVNVYNVGGDFYVSEVAGGVCTFIHARPAIRDMSDLVCGREKTPLSRGSTDEGRPRSVSKNCSFL